ncbi:MAG TPA: hypothetical protein VJU77_01635 [Chthoniobacterales bacterium]|nr:hypothetical protein [Chthoniobacterales bacterium]
MKHIVKRLALGGIALVLFAARVALAGAPAAPDERVFVSGDGAKTTMEIRYTPDLTVVRAIIRGGGLGDFGGTPIYLIRAAQVTKLDSRSIFESGQDIPLKPWDIIVIGKGVRSSEWPSHR